MVDTRFRIPGIPLGFDSFLGIIPGVGDVVTTGPSLWMIRRGHRRETRDRVLARMAADTGIDMAVGAIPIPGDVFDLVSKALRRNARVLHRELGRSLAHA